MQFILFIIHHPLDDEMIRIGYLFEISARQILRSICWIVPAEPSSLR